MKTLKSLEYVWVFGIVGVEGGVDVEVVGSSLQEVGSGDLDVPLRAQQALADKGEVLVPVSRKPLLMFQHLIAVDLKNYSQNLTKS